MPCLGPILEIETQANSAALWLYSLRQKNGELFRRKREIRLKNRKGFPA